MTSDRKLLWYIDAWDSRAGRAFLCHREADTSPAPVLDQSVIYVAPPYFQPEPLASRAPGLAASRATYQAGFFIDEEEIGFPTLDDAIAFIKRGYNSHGSEPTPGVPVTPIGPRDDGDLGMSVRVPEFGEFSELDKAISDCVNVFASLRIKADRTGKPEGPMSWEVPQQVLASPKHYLNFAAHMLMDEMLRSFPNSGAAEAILDWAISARQLGGYLINMGVWWDVVQAVDSNRHTHAYKNILQHMNHSGLDASLERFLSYLVPEPYWYMRQLPKQTVLEDLALFKLPRSVDLNYRVESFQPTMLTLLSRWLSSPPDKSSAADRALLLFASACVVVQAQSDAILLSALGVVVEHKKQYS